MVVSLFFQVEKSGKEERESRAIHQLSLGQCCFLGKWDSIALRQPTLITTSIEIHVPFMDTEHSGFYNICSKEGETSAAFVPNSSVNKRCFSPWYSQKRTSLFAYTP